MAHQLCAPSSHITKGNKQISCKIVISTAPLNHYCCYYYCCCCYYAQAIKACSLVSERFQWFQGCSGKGCLRAASNLSLLSYFPSSPITSDKALQQFFCNHMSKKSCWEDSSRLKTRAHLRAVVATVKNVHFPGSTACLWNMFENTWNYVSLFVFHTDNGQNSGYKYIKSLLRTPKSESVWVPSECGLSNKSGAIPMIFSQDHVLPSTKSLDSLNGCQRWNIYIHVGYIFFWWKPGYRSSQQLLGSYFFFSFQRNLMHMSLKKKKNPYFPNWWIFNFLLHWERYPCTCVESTCSTSIMSKHSNSCQT